MKIPRDTMLVVPREILLVMQSKENQRSPDIQAVVLNNITKYFLINDECLPQNDQIRGGKFFALDDVSLSIEEGCCTIIAGANGSGKSVLMSIIAGLESPSGGGVKTSGRTGLVFQEPDAQILGETPREDIGFGPRNMGFSKQETLIRVEAALAASGLCERADFYARSLSGGEKRRLAAASVLAMDAEIIIFDEPYANMDYPGVLQINALFEKLIHEKKTLLILTHELEKCLALAGRFIVLYMGKKVFDGEAKRALECDLESWGIRHPLKKKTAELGDLIWRAAF